MPRQFSQTEGQSMSSHPTLLMSDFGGMFGDDGRGVGESISGRR